MNFVKCFQNRTIFHFRRITIDGGSGYQIFKHDKRFISKTHRFGYIPLTIFRIGGTTK